MSRHPTREAACATLSLLFSLVASQAQAQILPPPPCGPNQSCPGQPAPPPSCSPAPGGPPAPAPADCGAPAAQPTNSGPTVGAGNPINVITGNKYQHEVDLSPLPGVLGLELVRHYNSAYSSATAPNGILGRGWRLSYETTLSAIGSTLQIVQADGARITFNRDPRHPSVCSSADPSRGQVLVGRDAQGEHYTWVWNDGRRLSFDAKGKLTQILAPTGEFVTLQHDGEGHLLKVTDPQGRSLRLNYLDARANKGDRFAGVQSIDTPVGRYVYEYGSALPKGSPHDAKTVLANLVKVKLPTHHEAGTKAHAYTDRGVSSSSVSRIYHYEDAKYPTLLSGISVLGSGSDGKLMNQRLRTWAYDTGGRAVLSVMGDGKDGIEKVTLKYELESSLNGKPGQTVLTNSLGRTTIYRHRTIAGEYRLIEVRGAGCASCGESDMRYEYDHHGRLLASVKLDRDGKPLYAHVSESDNHGRVTRSGRIDYSNGKPQAPRWLVRYEYEAPAQAAGVTRVPERPVLIARPSVVPGREHTLRIAYNPAGQPTRITEEGYSPLDTQGNPLDVADLQRASRATRISRNSIYSYDRINNRNVLVQIDGPLPNGPKGDASDSDITRLRYDAKGDRIAALVSPLGLEARFKYDDAGRLIELTGPSGLTDTHVLHPDGLIASVTQSRDGRALAGTAYKYDALGRQVEVLALVGDRPLPQLARGFDVADRLVWQAHLLGVLQHAAYDSEGHVLRSTVQTASFKQEERYAYDAQGRLARVDDNTGAVRGIAYDAADRIVATLDPLGRLTRYAYDAQSRLQNVTQAANTDKPLAMRYERDAAGRLREVSFEASDGIATARRVTTRLLKDDFGREVAVLSPDSGTVVKRFDEAGRLRQLRNATGALTDIDYDIAGRVLRRTVTPNAALGAAAGGIPTGAAKPQTTLYRYEGTRLAQVNDANQRESYGYDDAGRVVTHRVTLALVGGGEAVNVVRYRYDDRGALVAQSMPDGAELRYERNGQGQVVALHRHASAWSWFGWGRATLVAGLERDLVGLRRATYSNGVTTLWQRSPEGVLARVVHLRPAQDASMVRTAFERLMSEARAQSAAAPGASASAPGAFGMPAEPRALWDGRLLMDAAGNVLMQGQFARSEVAQPLRTGYAYDAQDQLAQAARAPAQAASPTMPVAARPETEPTVWRYHHDSLGNRLLAQEQQPAGQLAQTVKLAYQGEHSDRLTDPTMDAAGQPRQDGDTRYEWDEQGRLTGVRNTAGAVASYRYNHRAERVSKQAGGQAVHYLYDARRQRVAELDEQGRITRQYVWLADQLVAVVDPKQPVALRAPAEGPLEELAQALREAWAQISGQARRVAYVHTNHLGAPVAMTGQDGTPIWSTDYAPFGQRITQGTPTGALKTSAPGRAPQAGIDGIGLDLRLPGQWEDTGTGLYYNDFRYYDPQKGRYLSPDPFGLRGGVNPYAYVGNNPVGFSDPLGLILIAFDGTGNNSNANNGDGRDFTNIWWMHEFYDTAAVGQGFRRYQRGIGTDPNAWDITNNIQQAIATEGHDFVDAQLQNLDNYVQQLSDPNERVVLDVIGFSRGAALARDFSNRVLSRYREGRFGAHCFEFRFLGLFDTVSQFGVNGRRDGEYNFSIATEWRSVAHAYALNEHRSLFPLRSVNRGVERGFVGAHSDVGGGYNTAGEAFPGDLSDVALNWMIRQAEAAGVRFRPLPDELRTVSNPVVHDQRNTSVFYGMRYERPIIDQDSGMQTGVIPPDERRVIRPDGSTVTQPAFAGRDPTYGPMMEGIIQRPARWEYRTDNCAGQVEMAGYREWLRANYGVQMIAAANEGQIQPCQARPR